MTSPQSPSFLSHHVRQKIDDRTGHHLAKLTLGFGRPVPGDVIMQSNDYLSLADDPRIAQAKADALLAHGHGDAISRVFAHHKDDAHRAFEKRIAQMAEAEDACLVMSGYNTNVGIMECFAVPGRPVYIDGRAHASLWAGVIAAGAKAVPFAHNDVSSLQAKIARHGSGIIAIDSLYSTNGATAPLQAFVDAAEQADCVLIVDETHSFGTHGPDGAGMVVAEGLSDRVHFRTIGLSKAMAARGGVAVGSAENIECFRYEARSMIFSTSVLGYEVAGFDETLDIIAAEPWRQQALHANHAKLRAGLAAVGFDVAASDSQIIAIVTGTNENTEVFRDALAEKGVYASVFLTPATPVDASLIRFTVNATLTESDMAQTIEACVFARKQVSLRAQVTTAT